MSTAGKSHDHIYRQFDAELATLKSKLLLMGRTVHEQLLSTFSALAAGDAQAAEQVAQGDWRINRMEMDVDEQCVRMIALRQPAASDLRFLITALKLDTDLERIGDLTVNIAERVAWLARSSLSSPSLDLTPMSEAVQALLRDALVAFNEGDTKAAQQLLERDVTVDQIFATSFDVLVHAIQAEPANVERAMRLLFIGKHLERIADHVTNIAELVIYMVDGKDVRHRFGSGHL
jgi:phosphate transport system protein